MYKWIEKVKEHVFQDVFIQNKLGNKAAAF